jgi:hypothetical protein
MERFYQLGCDYEGNGPVDDFGNSTEPTCTRNPNGTIDLYLYSSCKNYDLQLEGFLYMVTPYVSSDSPQAAGVLKSEDQQRAALITWDGGKFTVDHSNTYSQGVWS